MQGERGGFTRGGGQNNMMQTPQDRHGNEDLDEARRGGERRVGDRCRQREEGTLGQENPWR